MLDHITVVTDLGPGDGGKGGIVHALSCHPDVSLIIKRGGAQGSHGVRTSSGESFNFSQWSCGTFEGIPTFLSNQMVISPVGLDKESEALRRRGINDPYQLLFCDPYCICATPYHLISSQIEELVRGKHPRGTIGTGVGQAYRMNSNLGEVATIRARHLSSRRLVNSKLRVQRDCYREWYQAISLDDFLPEDRALAAENLELLVDPEFLDYCCDLLVSVGQKLQFTYLSTLLSQVHGRGIVECSHGVLTDAETGLKPHVSAIRTLPKFTETMLRAGGYLGEISHLAVHRAYEIRHGAGPMPTYDPDFTSRMLPDSHKETNRWQGAVRAGALDLPLLRHALGACSETTFDGLCLTWFDQILANHRVWPLCPCYQDTQRLSENYTNFLFRAKPCAIRIHIEQPISGQKLMELAEETLRSFINIPRVTMLSVGPTEKDKIFSL